MKRRLYEVLSIIRQAEEHIEQLKKQIYVESRRQNYELVKTLSKALTDYENDFDKFIMQEISIKPL